MIKHRHEFIENKWSLLVIAVAVGWLNIAFILAVLDGQIVRVLLLFYLSPVWAALLGWLVLKEELHINAWFMVLIAMTGAIIMLWSPELGMPFPKDKSDWLALSAGFSFAFANMMIRKNAQISIAVKTMTGWLGVILVSGLLIIISMTPPGTLTINNVTWALVYGICGMTLMTLSVVYGVSHMPIHRSSIILLFEIVVGAVSAVWLADEKILPQEWWGGSLVILAAYLSARLEIKEEDK
jgi:drug/metabolite transporter (DMT)-like permease